MPVPFSGGNISKEKLFFVTVYQVDYSHFSFVIFVRLAKILHIGNKNTKRNEKCRNCRLFFYTADGKSFIVGLTGDMGSA